MEFLVLYIAMIQVAFWYGLYLGRTAERLKPWARETIPLKCALFTDVFF